MALTEIIVKYNGDIASAARSAGGTAEIISSNYAIFSIDSDNIPMLYGYTEIEDIEVSKNL